MLRDALAERRAQRLGRVSWLPSARSSARPPDSRTSYNSQRPLEPGCLAGLAETSQHGCHTSCVVGRFRKYLASSCERSSPPKPWLAPVCERRAALAGRAKLLWLQSRAPSFLFFSIAARLDCIDVRTRILRSLSHRKPRKSSRCPRSLVYAARTEWRMSLRKPTALVMLLPRSTAKPTRCPRLDPLSRHSLACATRVDPVRIKILSTP